MMPVAPQAPPARFEELAPDAYRAMRGLDAALWVEPRLRELVEARTAQLNGCAESLARHAQEALELGESPRRLAALADWRRSSSFDRRERAALALADALAVPAPEAVAGAREHAAEHFDEHEVAQLVFACVAANARDRLLLAVRR